MVSREFPLFVYGVLRSCRLCCEQSFKSDNKCVVKHLDPAQSAVTASTWSGTTQTTDRVTTLALLVASSARTTGWCAASALPAFTAVSTRRLPLRMAAGSSNVPASLNREQFTKTLELTALRLTPRQCSSMMKRLSGHVLHRQRIKAIFPAPDDASTKLMLLNESIGPELAELPVELREFVRAEGVTSVRHELRLGYEHLTAAEVLGSLLPAGMDVPSAFEQVGHVAHINLRDEHGPYKALIGEVLLDKNSPRIRSVVNKMDSISNEFRVFPMEVVAGEDDLLTSVKENGAKFELDYREVYWNSRLETEHKRILEVLGSDAVVADAFAGIGPFAVPAAMRGCRVYANDLNPKSHEYLVKNVNGNKVVRNVKMYNLDGREFIHALLGVGAPKGDAADAADAGEGGAPEAAAAAATGALPSTLPFGYFSHVLMNLPASALTFLDAFVGAFDRDTWHAPLPMVHCYCFSKAGDPKADVIAIAEETMGCKLPGATAHVVRDVAPQKLMLCLEFQVPDSVAWRDAAGGGERAKRPRVE